MPNHAINKQVFDFTCSNESVAKQVRDEFAHFTAVQINRLIDAVLTEQDVDGSNIRIDVLEIELGDMPVPEFGNTDMLDKFRILFTEKLVAIRQAGHVELNKHAQPVPAVEVNLEVIKSFILHGDVPWWIDKAALPDPDKLLQELVTANPQAVKIFLEAYREDPVVLSRIRTQYKPVTKALLYKLLGLQPASIALLLPQGGLSGSRLSLLQVLLTDAPASILSALSLPDTATTHRKKQALINRLVKQGASHAVKHLIRLGLFPADDTPMAASATGNQRKPGSGAHIREWLDRLSFPQLQFLQWHFENKEYPDYPQEIAFWPEPQEQGFHTAGFTESGPQDISAGPGPAARYEGKDAPMPATALQAPLFPDSIHAQPQTSQTTPAVTEERTVYADKEYVTNADISPVVDTQYKQVQPEAAPAHKQRTVLPGIETQATAHTGETAKNKESSKAPSDSFAAHNKHTAQKEALPPEATTMAAFNATDDTGSTPPGNFIQRPAQNKTAPVAPPDNPAAGKAPASTKASADSRQRTTGDIDAQVEAHKHTHPVEPPAANTTAPGEQKYIHPPVYASPGATGNTSGKLGVDARPDRDKPYEQASQHLPGLVPASGTTDRAPGTGNTTGPLPEPVNKADQEHTAIPGRLETSPGSPPLPTTREEVKSSRTAFLMRGLDSANPTLLNYLKKLPGAVLEQLEKNFVDHARQNAVHKKNVRSLLEHPHLLKYNVLQLFAALSASQAAVIKETPHQLPLKKGKLRMLIRIKTAQTRFTAVLQALPWKETVILQDVFAKRRISSQSEKNLIKKILLRSPAEAVELMCFIAGLPEDKLEQLQPAGTPAPAAGEGWQPPAYAVEADSSSPKKFYIANAGLCLVALYLPGLFHQLGYIENKAFKNKAFLTRALYVLQYIATGRPAAPEYVLQFNKLLCGYEFEEGIALTVRLSKREKKEADELIESVIANWKALKNTSAEGFRQSFLQRRGILFQNSTAWTLQVERQGHDLLLGTLSWGYTMIKLPWMKKMIQVEW